MSTDGQEVSCLFCNRLRPIHLMKFWDKGWSCRDAFSCARYTFREEDQ